MTKQEALQAITRVDNLVANVRNPALTREEVLGIYEDMKLLLVVVNMAFDETKKEAKKDNDKV